MRIENIRELDEKYYMNTFGARYPIAFTHGDKATLYSADGKAYTDFLGGIAVNSLGYSDARFQQAICNQINSVIHYSNLFYIESQAKLAKLLIENSDFDKVFFANSGAEANEGAIKLVRKYHYAKNDGKYEIISANNSFHGRTLATTAATGQEKYQAPYKPLPNGFIQVDFNDYEALLSAVSHKTAGILLEVIQGEGGVMEADPTYLQAVERLCRQHDILLIIDEVQTGMGRTGTLFAYEQFGIKPDIITLAKALGNGVPIGAVLAVDSVCAFTPGDHGSTFGGNALACTAGVAVMEIIKEDNLLERVNILGNYFKSAMLKLKEQKTSIADVRGRGLILGMELSESVNGKDIAKAMLDKGYIINCAGHNTLRFVPPFVISEEEIDSMLSALSQLI